MEIIPTRANLTPEHEQELAAARAFIERYGTEFADQANEICREVALDMMIAYQAHEYPDTWRHKNLMRSLKQGNVTFAQLKTHHFKRMFAALDKLCTKAKLPRLAARDFIRGSQIGHDPSEDQIQKFWDDLWNQLPDKWRSADFRWHHIVFSGTELPFFVWIVRPPPRPPKGTFTVRRTKEEQAIFNEKLDKAIKKRNS